METQGKQLHWGTVGGKGIKSEKEVADLFCLSEERKKQAKVTTEVEI